MTLEAIERKLHHALVVPSLDLDARLVKSAFALPSSVNNEAPLWGQGSGILTYGWENLTVTVIQGMPIRGWNLDQAWQQLDVDLRSRIKYLDLADGRVALLPAIQLSTTQTDAVVDRTFPDWLAGFLFRPKSARLRNVEGFEPFGTGLEVGRADGKSLHK